MNRLLKNNESGAMPTLVVGMRESLPPQHTHDKRGHGTVALIEKIMVAMSIFAASGVVWGSERFPPPDFSNHKLPQTLVPSSPPLFYDYLDLAALLAGLSLASYFAVFKRSRRGLFILSIVSLLWLGFWREGCICPIGAIQNITLAVSTSNYALPLTVAAFFALPLVFTIFFGRTFCAAVCPLGAVQELAALKPLRVPAWLDHTLGLLAYIYLARPCFSPSPARRF